MEKEEDIKICIEAIVDWIEEPLEKSESKYTPLRVREQRQKATTIIRAHVFVW